MCLHTRSSRLLTALFAAVWLPAAPAAALLPGLPTVSDTVWDSAAVRRVLHTFAFGGQTTDYQISVWAAMRPEQAIKQIQSQILRYGTDDWVQVEPADQKKVTDALERLKSYGYCESCAKEALNYVLRHGGGD